MDMKQKKRTIEIVRLENELKEALRLVFVVLIFIVYSLLQF
jgi:hypothetical protein